MNSHSYAEKALAMYRAYYDQYRRPVGKIGAIAEHFGLTPNSVRAAVSHVSILGEVLFERCIEAGIGTHSTVKHLYELDTYEARAAKLEELIEARDRRCKFGSKRRQFMPMITA